MDSSDFMSGPSEVGSLTAQSNEESQFVGSSSGVYFINTVRQAFSRSLGQGQATSQEASFPPPEDTLVGSEDSPCDEKHHPPSSKASPSMTGEAEVVTAWSYDPTVTELLGRMPPLETARELMMVYFKVWHPLFPFLHGPTFLLAMESLYAEGHDTSGSSHRSAASEHRSACWTTIFQCVFNLASFLRPDLPLPPGSKIKSPANIHHLLGTLSYRHDIPSLQALLAAQLYLVATMCLRAASTVGGCILRSMLHGGLHRCPFRYRQLSSHDRHLRKRIFWCAYAIDRYLSQALGLPLGIQDSDVGVCLPGAAEVHAPTSLRGRRIVASRASVLDARSATESRARNGETDVQTESASSQALRVPEGLGGSAGGSNEQQSRRELVLASYVQSGKLTGRALELFHKSIDARSIRRSSVLFLVSDVHKWWNSLPPDLQGNPSKFADSGGTTSTDDPFDFGPFFTVLYQHLILIIHRPTLSLDPSTPDFCSGLQTCIGAARAIIAALRSQNDGGQAFFWPGFLSAAWMSGLVLAFACQLGQYVLSKGLQEIDDCLEFLQIMSAQWDTARHCHTALLILSRNIRKESTHLGSSAPRNADGSIPRKRSTDEGVSDSGDGSAPDSHRNKRQRDDTAPGPPAQTSSAPPDRNTEHSGKVAPSHAAEANPSFNTHSDRRGVSTTPAPTTQFHRPFFQDVPLPANPAAIIQQNSPPYPPSINTDDRQYFDDSSQWTTGVNFDLNMMDLLQGANVNFDPLFDMIGQHFPSF